jgi:hypothetical protein
MNQFSDHLENKVIRKNDNWIESLMDQLIVYMKEDFQEEVWYVLSYTQFPPNLINAQNKSRFFV